MHQSIDKKNKILTYFIFLLILSTTNGKFSEKKKFSLKIDKINVAGLPSDKNLKIQNELKGIFYQNIIIVGKEEINRIIKKYNIIEEYKIKKVYPSTLNIEIKPTKFVAKVTDGNQLIVGANGKLIFSELNEKILPYISGEFDSEEFLKFKKNVEISKFNFTEFKTVIFFPSNRWDVLTIDGILIKLPQSDMSESLNMAHKILASTQFKDKSVIDLRIKSHLITK
jgi:cell division protein FtsQ